MVGQPTIRLDNIMKWVSSNPYQRVAYISIIGINSSVYIRGIIRSA